MGRPTLHSRPVAMRGWSIAIIALALIVGACGDSDGDDGSVETTAATTSTSEGSTSTTAATTSIPPETTATSTPADDSASAALEAAEQFFPALEAAWGYNGTGTPDPNHPDLQRWIAPPVLTNFESSLGTAAGLGQFVEGEAPYRIVEGPSLNGDGTFTTLVCNADDADLINPDGTIASPADPTPRLFELIQVETGDGWATSEFILVENAECAL